MTDRLTTQQLDDIETRAAGLYEYATGLDAAWQDEADQLAGKDVPALLAEIRRLQARLAELESPAVVALERAFAAELNDDRALILLDGLTALRAQNPCTCARSQGLHEKGCPRYVPGHDLLSPARRLARAREELVPTP
jgi:hypothetical protein